MSAVWVHVGSVWRCLVCRGVNPGYARLCRYTAPGNMRRRCKGTRADVTRVNQRKSKRLTSK